MRYLFLSHFYLLAQGK